MIKVLAGLMHFDSSGLILERITEFSKARKHLRQMLMKSSQFGSGLQFFLIYVEDFSQLRSSRIWIIRLILLKNKKELIHAKDCCLVYKGSRQCTCANDATLLSIFGTPFYLALPSALTSIFKGSKSSFEGEFDFWKQPKITCIHI